MAHNEYPYPPRPEEVPLYKRPNVVTARYVSGLFAVLASAGALAVNPNVTGSGDVVGPKALARAQITRFAYDAAHHQMDKGVNVALPPEKFSPGILLDYHNIARQEAGLEPLKPSIALDASAQKRADYLAKIKTFGHISNWWQLPELYLAQEHPGKEIGRVGENLAWRLAPNQDSQNLAMALWLTSPGHYANIIDTHFSEVGFGESLTQSGHEIFVAHFGGYKKG